MQRAFTLIELVLVMATLGIAAAIAVPRFAEGSHTRRLDAFEQRLLADIEHARRLAQARSASVMMVFDPINDTYVITGARNPVTGESSSYMVQTGDSPYRIDLQTVDLGGDAVLIHDGYGTRDSGGTITIASGDLTRTITIDAP